MEEKGQVNKGAVGANENNTGGHIIFDRGFHQRSGGIHTR